MSSVSVEKGTDHKVKSNKFEREGMISMDKNEALMRKAWFSGKSMA